MARMHSRKKGKSGSRRPLSKKAPSWVDYKKDEIEKLVVKLRNDGLSQAMIGTVLRDSYGIPGTRITAEQTVGNILKKNSMASEYPEDILNLMKRAVNLRKHMDGHKKDLHSRKGLQCIEAKIRRLGKYYVRKKILPAGWKYEPKKAKIIIQ